MIFTVHGTEEIRELCLPSSAFYPLTKIRYIQKIVQPHTNLTEIEQGLNLLWRNGISSRNVVLGLGFCGRSFTPSNSACNTPGCPFSGNAAPGECTKTSGVLSNSELHRIIKENNLTAVLDEAAGVKYVSWNSDQWVSYDDADTLKMKMDFAANLGLGGTSKHLHILYQVSELTRTLISGVGH